MALDAINKKQGNGVSGNAPNMNGSFHTSVQNTHNPANTNVQPDKKLVFLVGTNIPAHYTLRHTIDQIADLGIPCEIYLTELNPKPGSKLAEKLARPESKNLSFFERLPIKVLYPILEKYQPLLSAQGELRGDLQYTPGQIADYYRSKGVTVTVDTLQDVNDPAFVTKIASDPNIARSYNIRSLQILQAPTIKAFESKTHSVGGHTFTSQILNVHPGDVIAYPGTNIAFWNRKNGEKLNIWSLHVIDSGIDTGDFLDKKYRPMKPGKTLMQDMMIMADPAAEMISGDAHLCLLNGTPRQPIPQNQRPDYASKPHQNYTHATHDEFNDAYLNTGVRQVNPDGFIKAVAVDYTGSLTSDLSLEVQHEMAKAVLQWQHDYLALYRAAYNKDPLDYDANNPSGYFIDMNDYPPPGSPPAAAATATTSKLNGAAHHAAPTTQPAQKQPAPAPVSPPPSSDGSIPPAP